MHLSLCPGLVLDINASLAQTMNGGLPAISSTRSPLALGRLATHKQPLTGRRESREPL